MPEISPEVQQQLEEQKKNCPFCKIIKGEIQSEKVYDDKHISGILDINPWVKGHTLIVPKEHFFIMPQLPPDTFKHIFGILPKISGCIKKAMLTTGLNIFIANGGIAGQQSPHFLFHILPREEGDRLDLSLSKKKEIEQGEADKSNKMLATNLPIMMNNHFQRSPTGWHTGKVETASHLKDIKESSTILYEDEKVLCISPEKKITKGHLIIYSQEEEKDFENLDDESASHLFYVASYCATAVFEGLQAQGSNIILQSGISDDNDNMLKIHILPRYEKDGISYPPRPMSKKPDFKALAGKIKDKTFIVEYELKNKKEERPTINLDDIKRPEKIEYDPDNEIEEKEVDAIDEIKAAIERIRGI